MVVILTAETAKSESRQAEVERRGRITNLEAEETRLVSSVNGLRDAEREARKEHDASVQRMRNEYSAEKTELEVELGPLRKERAELMKPIEVIREEAQQRLSDVIRREEAITLREEVVTKKETDLNEREAEFLEKSEDRGDELDDREQALDTREAGIKREEERLKESGATLAERWAEYHRTVEVTNKDLTQREKAVEIGAKANADRALTLDAQEERNRNDRRGIEDTYRAIEQAKKHLGIQ